MGLFRTTSEPVHAASSLGRRLSAYALLQAAFNCNRLVLCCFDITDWLLGALLVHFGIRYSACRVMNDSTSKLEAEVEELRAEVRRLRWRLKWSIAILLLAAPQLLLLTVLLGTVILAAFLVSPVRGMIFSYLFGLLDASRSDS